MRAPWLLCALALVAAAAAGCVESSAAPREDPPVAASAPPVAAPSTPEPAPASEEPEEEESPRQELALGEHDGAWLVASHAPWAGASCERAGTVVADGGAGEGAWVSYELPEGALALRVELVERAAPLGGLGYRLCVFADGALVASDAAMGSIELLVESGGVSRLDVLVTPDAFPGPLVNLEAKVEWTLEGWAVVPVSGAV